MGIADLIPTLKAMAPAAFLADGAWQARIPRGSVVAVDIAVQVHRIVYSRESVNAAIIFADLMRVRDRIRAAGWVPLWVLDGAPLKLKDAERAPRRGVGQGGCPPPPDCDCHLRAHCDWRHHPR